jgi:hypothetical protein
MYYDYYLYYYYILFCEKLDFIQILLNFHLLSTLPCVWWRNMFGSPCAGTSKIYLRTKFKLYKLLCFMLIAMKSKAKHGFSQVAKLSSLQPT